MKYKYSGFFSHLRFAFLAIALLASTVWADGQVAYDFALEIEPDESALYATVRINLPSELAGQTVEFLLTDAVEIASSEPEVKRISADGIEGFIGINGSSVSLTETGHVARYQLRVPDDGAPFELRYEGRIDFALGDQKEQYTRGFRSTSGIIGEEGIYLAGSSLWYPYFSDELVSFQLTTNVPEGWHVISQGNGTSWDEHGTARWDSGGAVDEIYLVGGPLIRYSEPAGAVAAEVYLHEKDDALAKRYLTATAQYLAMYRDLIGPYPYNKFALVENFWETGYGMPSFTLLGPQIIRFPFILTSSYPHEILHNWWGNSVFVDYPSGNWCEGLTAYMADHLMQEQRGTGSAYRRDTLKRYRDFVKEDRDFPLTEFRSRHSASTEAIGYGKTLMGFHMLRLQLGDEVFKQGLARFYRNFRGKKASFSDVRAELEEVSGQNLESFFQQWVDWTGAPDLIVENVTVEQHNGKFQVRGELVQRQSGQAYEFDVPVYITTGDGFESSRVELSGNRTEFQISTADRPMLLEVDPEFDMFRLLDPRETASSIGQIFGEPQIFAVLPSSADAAVLAGYRELVEAWRSDTHEITVVLDTEIDAIPADRAAWLFGAENRLAPALFASNPGLDLSVTENAVSAQGQVIPLRDHSSILVLRHVANMSKAVGWINVDPPEAFDGIANKLPHYGKYSFLGFQGAEPVNSVKGEWLGTDSPMRVDLRDEVARVSGSVVAARGPQRRALAELPPAFSRERMMTHLSYLASTELGGRGLGTEGLEKAAEYIAEQFSGTGLIPGGDDGSFFQQFRVDEGEDGKPHDVRNVIGVIPGSNPDFDGQAVLLTAHYDHLGHGWPDVRSGDENSIYYGADDNASGVAVLIELANAFSEESAPQRSIVFIAFTAEEAGLKGSRYYAEHAQPVPLDGIIGVVNMDTIGRLEGQDISVFGAGTATEWPHVFRGVSFTVGVGSKSITTAMAASDQQSFVDKGIPGVQISTGANLDYHRPTDTVDKIDDVGLVKIATFVKETVAYLTERPEKLTATLEGQTGLLPERAPAGENRERRVSVGTVPDFAFAGPGVRVVEIVPDSPAAIAGIQAGDVLLEMAGRPIASLQAYTDLLKTLTAGESVPATIERDGNQITVNVAPTER
jgi:aminopeptidase N